MITGIGIPSNHSSSPLPIVLFPELLQKGAAGQRSQCRHTLRRVLTCQQGDAATATSIQLHLRVTNEISELSVPVTKENPDPGASIRAQSRGYLGAVN